MSHAAAISKRDASQFSENSVRLKIVCNGLRAFADLGHAGTAAEAKTFSAFFRNELPAIMRQNAAVLRKAIRAGSKSEHEASAMTDVMREDQERLVKLADEVIKKLGPAARTPANADREAIHRAISAYLAALQSHSDWSKKIISNNDPES